MKTVAIYHNDTQYLNDLIHKFSDKLPGHQVISWAENVSANYVLAWKPDTEIFKTKGLEIVFALGAGVDAFLGKTFPSQVKLIRLEEAGMGEQMLEVALYGILHYSRDMIALSQAQKNKEWKGVSTPKRAPLSVPIGIMGLGQLGGFIAEKLSAIGYSVSGFSRSKKKINGVTCYSEHELGTFLSSSEVLINLMPLTAKTENILNEKLFSLMPKGGYLINIARGKHLVEQELTDALNTGQLSGALLDVFRTEPLPKEHPFWADSRITVLPHLAAITMQSEAVRQISQNIIAFENSRPLTGEVDFSLGY